MPNYENGKIYKLICDKTDKIYIGSTVRNLNIRLSGHKNKTSLCFSKQLFELGEVKIELIENYPCNSRKELNTRERYFIEKYKDIVVNKVIPTRTNNEYYKEYLKNDEKKLQFKKNQKRYYDKSGLLRNEKTKILCDCGGKYVKRNKKFHQKTNKHKNYILQKNIE